MNAFAQCGVWEKEYKGETHVFFAYQDSVWYMDKVLNHALTVKLPYADKIHFLRARDEETRTDMAASVNGGMPGGLALRRAYTELKEQWRMADATTGVTKPSQPLPSAKPPTPPSRAKIRPAGPVEAVSRLPSARRLG